MDAGHRPEPAPARSLSGTRPGGLRPLAVRQSRSRDAFDAIRAAILTGELAPGSLHSVAEIADTFEVSRTPVREALIELASLGMVQFERNRGFRVQGRSVHDLEEIFELRLLLEVPTTRRAVERMDSSTLHALRAVLDRMEAAADAGDEHGVFDCDREFHRTLMTPAGNSRLTRYIDTLRDLTRLLGASTVGRTRTLHSVLEEHRRVLLPVLEGDADRAAEAMRLHLVSTATLLISQEGASIGDLLQPASAGGAPRLDLDGAR